MRGQKLTPDARDRLRGFIRKHPTLTARELSMQFCLSRETIGKHRRAVLGPVAKLRPPKTPAPSAWDTPALLAAAKQGNAAARHRLQTVYGLRKWWTRDGGAIIGPAP